jgi:hypothetical protein
MECELNLGGDGEPIEGWELRMVTDSTSSTCFECNREIPAGTLHEIVTGDFEGKPIEWHTCSDCMNIAKGLQTEGRVHGMLWTELEDCGGLDGDAAFEQFTSGCLKRVKTASAKAYLQERYRTWKGL